MTFTLEGMCWHNPDHEIRQLYWCHILNLPQVSLPPLEHMCVAKPMVYKSPPGVGALSGWAPSACIGKTLRKLVLPGNHNAAAALAPVGVMIN